MEFILNFGVPAFIGALAGLLLCTVILMTVLPFLAAANIFVNQPKGQARSGIHFFTNVGPGQVKIIVRGKKPVRMVMNTAGKRFARVGTKNDPSYWELVDGQSENPTDLIHWTFRWWASLVYDMTGAVFTGIYPIQRVYEYDLERTVTERSEDLGRDRVSESNLVLRVKSDVSDHFRARQFLFPVHITKADTNGKIPLDVIGVAELEVRNPHKAAFGTDRWDHAITNLITDTVTSETKQMTLDSALTGTSDADVRRIALAIKGITADEINCGISIEAFRILEINPVLEKEGLLAIQAEELAKQRAKATLLDGKARADNLRELNKANAEGGEHALASLEAEALVRAAEAASKGGGTVILMPSGSKNTDPTQAAILATLQQQKRNNTRRN